LKDIIIKAVSLVVIPSGRIKIVEGNIPVLRGPFRHPGKVNEVQQEGMERFDKVMKPEPDKQPFGFPDDSNL